ncbi:MAG: hypothetical protein SGI77_24835 [Pirellulaceae bacterium]|nr:hypothetical protein [Pirellulaceae bacterium]
MRLVLFTSLMVLAQGNTSRADETARHSNSDIEPAVFVAEVPSQRPAHGTSLDAYRNSMREKYSNPYRVKSNSNGRSSTPIPQAQRPHATFTTSSSKVVTASYGEPIRMQHAAPAVEYEISTVPSTCNGSIDSGSQHDFPYYFRPYQHTDIAKHQSASFITTPSNPYDNRFFESIYSSAADSVP